MAYIEGFPSVRIILGSRILLEPVAFDSPREWERRRGNGWEIERDIYLWDLKGHVGIDEPDDPIDITKAILIQSWEYDGTFREDFPRGVIGPPNRIVRITGDCSGLRHHIRNVREVCEILEDYQIDCFVSRDPDSPAYKGEQYRSPGLKRAASSRVRKISL